MSITCCSSLRHIPASFRVMSYGSFTFLCPALSSAWPASLSTKSFLHVLHFFLCWLLYIGGGLLSWLLLFCCCLLLLFSASFLLPSPRFRLKSSLCAVLFSYRVYCRMFLSMLICFVATLVPLLHRFQ